MTGRVRKPTRSHADRRLEVHWRKWPRKLGIHTEKTKNAYYEIQPATALKMSDQLGHIVYPLTVFWIPNQHRLNANFELRFHGVSEDGILTLVQREPESSVNTRIVQLVELLTELGPDVPEIARRLGQFKESVRYRYKEKILNKGFAVQAAVDHERLGLERIILVADFAPTYKNYAAAILTAMSEVSYVVGFTKSLIGGEYVVNLTVPTELVGEVRQFFLALQDRGMFAKLEILEFDWFRVVPMKPEFYDFDTGRWDFEWQNPTPQDYKAAAYLPSKRGKFDYIDLLIIKELQMDANKSLKEISEKLNINYKKLAWHHTAHVCSQKLLSGYTVNWMGTRYDYNLEKALHRKHRLLRRGLHSKRRQRIRNDDLEASDRSTSVPVGRSGRSKLLCGTCFAG